MLFLLATTIGSMGVRDNSDAPVAKEQSVLTVQVTTPREKEWRDEVFGHGSIVAWHEAVIGAESGEVAIFTGNGARNNLPAHNTPITRIDVGRLGNERYVVIADGTEVRVEKINASAIPGFQFAPLIVGGIVSAIILVIAGILSSIPRKPEMKVSFQDKSRESLEAQRRMLKESIADVERLRQSGEVTGDAYLARLKRLRADLAENEAAFKAQGYPIRVETVQCPNCGGTLELGMDKCEYCGQVLLS